MGLGEAGQVEVTAGRASSVFTLFPCLPSEGQTWWLVQVGAPASILDHRQPS